MMASPAAMGAGFMEARTIEAAAAGEAANGANWTDMQSGPQHQWTPKVV